MSSNYQYLPNHLPAEPVDRLEAGKHGSSSSSSSRNELIFIIQLSNGEKNGRQVSVREAHRHDTPSSSSRAILITSCSGVVCCCATSVRKLVSQTQERTSVARLCVSRVLSAFRNNTNTHTHREATNHLDRLSIGPAVVAHLVVVMVAYASFETGSSSSNRTPRAVCHHTPQYSLSLSILGCLRTVGVGPDDY